jgi:hypothetical protein
MQQSKTAKTVLKVVLSLWALYHITAILVMPNLGSYLGRGIQPAIATYASTIGFNAGWNFFSPDPAHIMYIRYIIHYGNEGSEEKEAVEAYFPPEKNKGIFSITRQRELYAMRFMVIDPMRLKTLFGPWLCRQYPGSSYVEMEHVIETIAPLQQIVTLTDETVESLSKEVQFVRANHSCDGSGEDEVLQ